MYKVEYWHERLCKWILLCWCDNLDDAIQHKITYESSWRSRARITNKAEGVYVV